MEGENSSPQTKNTRIYRNPDLDPAYRQIKQDAVREARKIYKAENEAYRKGKGNNPALKKPDAFRILTREYFKFLIDFADKNPEKAQKYMLTKDHENPLLGQILNSSLQPSSEDRVDVLSNYFENSVDEKNTRIKPSKSSLRLKKDLEKMTTETKAGPLRKLFFSSPIGGRILLAGRRLKSERLVPQLERLGKTRVGKATKLLIGGNPFKLNPVAKKGLTAATNRIPNERVKKTVRQYQERWNNTKLAKATRLGYDRFSLFKKLRSLKKWATTSPTATKARLASQQFIKKNILPGNSPARRVVSIGGQRLQGITRPMSRPSSWATNMIRGQRPFGVNSPGRKAAGAARNVGGRAKNQVTSKLQKEALKAVAKLSIQNPYVLAGIIAGIFVLGLILAIIIAITGGGESELASGLGGEAGTGGPGGDAPNKNPIPGLTLNMSVNKTQIPSPETIEYTISYTYNPPPGSLIKLEDITVYDQLPATVSIQSASSIKSINESTNTISWKLSDPGNTSPFIVLVNPKETNIEIKNSAFALASGAAPAAPSGGQSSNACTRPHEGTGHCSYENLLPYFGNSQQNALTASLICNLESGSNPFAKNAVCPDYSIGLFQINLVAHCGGAYANLTCSQLINASLRDACEQRFLNPIENIQYAYQLYQSGGTGWTSNKWSTYPKAQRVLASCGTI